MNGAEDPISALVPMLEEARAFGVLLKEGWRPKRTIVYCAWDGEEPMLLGSTEWAEAHADELRRYAVAYLNTDSNGRGYLGVDGSHTLEPFVNDVARDVEDPEAKVPVWKRAQARALADASSAEKRKEIRQRRDLRLDALGSGSDYTVFIDHLGIASLNLGYGGEDDGGIYHSIYDDFHWYTHFSDSDFVYGRALAQTVGLAVLRLADAELLPFDFSALADTTQEYLKDLKKLLRAPAGGGRRAQPPDRRGRLPGDPRPAAADAGAAEGGGPAPPQLRSARERGRGAPAERRPLRDGAGRGGGPARVPPEVLARVNALLIRSERVLLSPEGLPAPAVVQAPPLRARRLRRLRRQDDARRAGGDRAEALRRGRRRRSRASPRPCRTRPPWPTRRPRNWRRRRPDSRRRRSAPRLHRSFTSRPRLETPPLRLPQ